MKSKSFDSIAGLDLDDVYEMYRSEDISEEWIDSLSDDDRERLEACISMWGDSLLMDECQWGRG